MKSRLFGIQSALGWSLLRLQFHAFVDFSILKTRPNKSADEYAPTFPLGFSFSVSSAASLLTLSVFISPILLLLLFLLLLLLGLSDTDCAVWSVLPAVMDSSGRLLSVHPEELIFQPGECHENMGKLTVFSFVKAVLLELEKQCFSELKVANDSEHHVAFKVLLLLSPISMFHLRYSDFPAVQSIYTAFVFKVKTTSPRKYFVRPNAGVIQPWGSCMINDEKLPIRKHRQFDSDLVLCKLLPFEVTLQSQQEYPLDMQCKDKFLLQSTKVPPATNMDEIPPDTFSKEGDKVIEERKLRVIYRIANAGQRSLGAETSLGNSKQSSDSASGQVGLHRLKDERDSTLHQNQLLRQELLFLGCIVPAVLPAMELHSDMFWPGKLEKMKRRRSHGGEGGLSLTLVTFVGVAGIIFGVMLNLVFSSPSSE
ncbi:hypothetical protein ACLOJK_030491 [Asimina triloba]